MAREEKEKETVKVEEEKKTSKPAFNLGFSKAQMAQVKSADAEAE
jgi:hypothetical protein